MQVLNIIFIVFSVTCATAKPYEYSYYISTPTHYQSLAVNDGAAIVNAVNPNVRQGRGPEFNPSNPLDRRYHSNGQDFNRGIVGDQYPNVRQGRVGPGFDPRAIQPLNGPDFRRRIDGGLGPNVRQGRVGPGFNPIERYPTNDPDFRRGTDGEFDPNIMQNGFDPNRRYPSYRPDFQRRSEDIPDRELDPMFNQEDLRRRFPNSEQNPGFNQIGPYSPNQNNIDFDNSYPEFGRRIRPRMQPYTGISRGAPAPEANEDREEVTTPAPCTFCGIDKVNGRDGIDETDPDSETVEPKNSNRQNNVVTPANAVLPFPYYVVV